MAALRVFSALCVAACLVAPAAARAQGSTSTIIVASFGGGLDVGYKQVFAKFEQDNHVTIRWEAGSASGNVAKIIAGKAAPEYDVAMVEDVAYMAGVDKDVWARIDPSIVTNYADLYPQTRQPADAGVPIGGLSEGIFYRPEEMTKLHWPLPVTWEDLARKEYCGRVAMSHPNSSDGLRTLIMMAGGNPDGVPAVIDRLAANKSCYPVLETTSPKLEEKVKIGEYYVGTVNSIRAIPLIHSGVPIKFFIPKEGTIESFSIAAPVKGGPADPKLVQKFLNWFIDAGVQKQLMEILAYSPTNTKVVVPKDLAEMGVLDSEGMKHVVKIDSATVDKLRRNWARQTDRAWSN